MEEIFMPPWQILSPDFVALGRMGARHVASSYSSENDPISAVDFSVDFLGCEEACHREISRRGEEARSEG